MYYVGKDSYPYWEKQVRDALSSAAYDDYTEKLTGGDTYKIEKHDGFFFRSLNKSIMKNIKRNIYNYKANTTAASSY
ncbi:hypothetical protein SDC9_184716 [bioreactor metagenome]|uniref:Uncharacterized protein n=1 Tax=bioreactor metagenome TaxID=1076179 RepID=A0A645HEP1_9ZZZZ